MKKKEEKTLALGHGDKIRCVEFDDSNIVDSQNSQIFFNANATIVVVSGSARLSVNYQDIDLEKNMAVFLSSRMFVVKSVSEDFKCFALVVSKRYIDEFDTNDVVPIRTKYTIKMYHFPVVQLKDEDVVRLKNRWSDVRETIFDTSHFYYDSIVRSVLHSFFFDLSNYFEHYSIHKERSFTKQEKITHYFLNLLMMHFKEEHNVEFYADKLNISKHYLSFIVKKTMKQTPATFINDMLYGEARLLLSQSELSIQEIAMNLNFSDQSAFGKFFKRNSGMSPFVYRQHID